MSLLFRLAAAGSVAADLRAALPQQRASQRRRFALRQPARLAGDRRSEGLFFLSSPVPLRAVISLQVVGAAAWSLCLMLCNCLVNAVLNIGKP